MRIDEALAHAVKLLENASDSPRLDAGVLLARAINLPKSYLFAHPEEPLDDASAERFFTSVAQRCDGAPLSYITGEKEFWSLNLAVGPGVLVPRPETETLVELALRHIPRSGEFRLLDLGTGSGAIAIALASERPNCSIVATDISSVALATARQNARRHGLGNIEFLEGDWTKALGEQESRRFGMIVSNPPYVRADDRALEALRHEPDLALIGGDDGLDAVRSLARDCARLLEPGGLLLLEHGAEQKTDVADILAAAGWSAIESFVDLAGRPRVTQAAAGSTVRA